MKITIYGKPNCPQCESAKMICSENGFQYDYVTVGTQITLEQLFEKVGSPVKSVPQVFITEGGFTEYVGGVTQLRSRIGL